MADRSAPQSTRRYRSRASSVEAIRSAALEILLTDNPESVTIREIAERADVAHVYIPQIFGSKAELFANIYPTAVEVAARTFTWPTSPDAGIRPELLRLARLALWLSAHHPDGVPDGQRPLASNLNDFITSTFGLDSDLAELIVERLIALVVIFAAAPTVVSPKPINLAAHIDLEFRLLAAFAESLRAT